MRSQYSEVQKAPMPPTSETADVMSAVICEFLPWPLSARMNMPPSVPQVKHTNSVKMTRGPLRFHYSSPPSQ